MGWALGPYRIEFSASLRLTGAVTSGGPVLVELAQYQKSPRGLSYFPRGLVAMAGEPFAGHSDKSSGVFLDIPTTSN